MFAELGVTTNFSFLRGASHPEELVGMASGFGLAGIGIADRNSLAGVVRAYSFARDKLKDNPLRVVTGARLVFADGTPDILAYPTDIEAYGRLTRMLTRGNRRAEKGSCILYLGDLLSFVEGLQLIVTDRSTAEDDHTPAPDGAAVGQDKPVRSAPVSSEENKQASKDAGRSALSCIGPLPLQQSASKNQPGPPSPLRNPSPVNRRSWPREARSDEGSPDVEGPPHPSRLRRATVSHKAGEGYARLNRLVISAPSKTRRRRAANDNMRGRPRPEWTPGRQLDLLDRLKTAAPGRVWIAATLLYGPRMRGRLADRAELARAAGLPLLATNDVMMHTPERRPLADVLHCIRLKTTLDAAGRRLAANAERHLKSGEEMARIFAEAPDAIGETVRFLDGIGFSLDELQYNYPDELRAGFETEHEALVALGKAGARWRYPGGVPDAVSTQLNHELKLVKKLDYAAYFLTVHDVVRFAREQGILCQGRGSAANSVLCYCLGITEIDPVHHQLLFERFISENRNEPPDIDVDFEHERREIVMQYIYEHYGRAHAGLVATVITYRTRSALRDVGKAFGLSEDTVSALSGTVWGYWSTGVDPKEARRIGLDPEEHRMSQVLGLANELAGFPRHLSQHTGGFVITRTPLDEVVPIGNAAMDDRTVIEWDKDDLDALRMIKIDVLALGMLTCLRKGFDLLGQHYGHHVTMAKLSRHEQEEACVYAMIQRADTLGVFQIESRAQMSMLPRLKPKVFYDLVIEVAIVRPGPIQGDMVHPYLRRRQNLEPVTYPSEELEEVLGKTLGVPLFQEQAMKIAIVAAGFTPDEADGLRRAMATFKKVGTISTFGEKMVKGMTAKGYPPDFAERCFKQIEGFGTYGFPESHAASFALLVYASAWLKCRYPDVFACALLNSQPMGFYAPAQIVRDARDHGVPVLPADINHSAWDYGLEQPGTNTQDEKGSSSLSLVGSAVTREPPTFSAPDRPTQTSSPEAPLPPRLGDGTAQRAGGEVRAGSNDARVEATSAPADSTRHAYRRATLPEMGREGCDPPGCVDPIAWDGEGRRTTGEGCASASQGGAPHSQPKPRLHPRHATMRDDIMGDHALRVGFRQIKGLRQEDMDRLVARRGRGYDSVRDLWLRADLSIPVLEDLAEADAFRSIGLDRRDALWAVRGLNRAGDKDDLPLFARDPATGFEADAALPPMPLGEHVVEDYRHMSLSLKAHPVHFVRPDLARRRILASADLSAAGNGRRVTVAGLVLVRQRPGSAHGTIFLTIEDETGVANIIVWPKIFEASRAAVIAARFLAVTGKLQHESGVTHIVAERFEDLTPMLTDLSSRGAEIQDLARADEVRQPQTFAAKTRGQGVDLGLKLGFPLAADTRTPKGEPVSDSRRPDPNLRRALPKGRNFH